MDFVQKSLKKVEKGVDKEGVSVYNTSSRREQDTSNEP